MVRKIWHKFRLAVGILGFCANLIGFGTCYYATLAFGWITRAHPSTVRRRIQRWQVFWAHTTLKTVSLIVGLRVNFSIPEEIRGYGHIKQRNREAARLMEADLLLALRSPESVRPAA